MKKFNTWMCALVLSTSVSVHAAQIAYIYGDVAADGTIPSGTAAPYDQMLLTDTGNTGCSQFKAMVEAEGYSISQHYDQTTTLNTAFLNQFDVIIFGLHQKVWSPPEKTALDTWIRAGGGILMYSDSAAGGFYGTVGASNPTGQNAVNNILSVYGMEVTVDLTGGTRAYTSASGLSNPIVWDRPVFEGEGVSPIAIDPSRGAQALIPLDEAYKVSGSSLSLDKRNITINNPVWAVIGHQQLENGNIIAIFDRQPMWNNGPGSDINERDNKEILRRIIRFLARDYGNSSEWIDLSTTNRTELTYRQWSGGTGQPGFDYTARNSLITVQQTTNLLSGSWVANSNWVETVSTVTESAETEMATVRLIPDTGNPARFARIAILPATNTPPPSSSTIAINCGGGAYTATDGTEYVADVNYSGGNTYSTGHAITGTEDDTLYQTERYNSGDLIYSIPVVNGDYQVTLKMAEIFKTAVGQRLLDVSIEGTQVIDDLDLIAVAGHDVAYDRSFSTTVSDGVLTIQITGVVDTAQMNAILVEKVVTQSSYEEWADQFGGVDVIGSATDDYDQDGISNFEEYALNGNYTVRLIFAETYWTAINNRVFDISLEGTLVIDDLDLYATAPGKWVAYDLEFPVTVSDGTLNITATSSVNNSLLNAMLSLATNKKSPGCGG